MNDRSNNTATLSVKELEELCRLYLDCRLTRLQERELHYVLLHTEAHTELIDEVRGMMDFALRLSEAAEKPAAASVAVRTRWWQRWSVANIAVSLLVLVASAATLTYFSASDSQTDITYLVYVDGAKVDDRAEVEAIIRADVDKANEMLARAAGVQEAQQRRMAEIQRIHDKYQKYMQY